MLEINYIVGYLPYNLKARGISKKKGFNYVGVVRNYSFAVNTCTLVNGINNYGFSLSEITPMLRPVEDLSKEIEIKEIILIPIVEIAKELYKDIILGGYEFRQDPENPKKVSFWSFECFVDFWYTIDELGKPCFRSEEHTSELQSHP